VLSSYNILSLPCSTGEEPYSIAIQLLMTGLPKQRFHIDAADISSQALQHAEAAVYYEHSFRHHDLSFRNKYFDALFDARIQRPYWKLHPHVQQCISFHLANILQPCPTLKPTYDIIFCRNLLIYFDEETKTKALRRLSAMLNPNGFLFLGHAGGGRQASSTEDFTTFNHRAFVWQKNPSNIIPSTQFQFPPAKPRQQSLPKKMHSISHANDNMHKSKPIISAQPTLKRIEQLANQGDLKEAKRQCEQYTSQHPSHAKAWYLLGVIMQASNHLEQAKQHFQKSLYLEPHHEDTLLQLIGIVEHEGNHVQAKRLRQRLEQRQV